MRTRPTVSLLAALGCLAAFPGCVTSLPPQSTQDTTKFTVENTDRFFALDPATQAEVDCTGLQERTLDDGRLEVVANVKNREAGEVRVQAECLFFDDQGQLAGANDAWQVVAIAGHATEVVRFTAPDAVAKRYSIRVRKTR
jgi:hypothetical protein